MIRRLIVSLAAFGVASAACVSVASAVIVPTDQDRFVAASGIASGPSGTDEDGGSASATDFDLFNAAEGVSVSIDDSFGNMATNQTTLVTATQLSGTGGVGGSAEAFSGDGYAETSGESRFDVSFDLTESATIELNGTLSNFDNGYSQLTLSGAGGEIFFADGGFNEELPFTFEDTLPAGSYRLVARSLASLYGDEFFTDYGSGDYNFSFEIVGAVSTEEGEPAVADLQVWPNPARRVLHIEHIGDDGAQIFDAAGRLIRVWATSTNVTWDLTTATGQPVANGVYFVRPNEVGATPQRVLVAR